MAIASIVALTWLALVASVYFFSVTQRNLTDLAGTHIPRLSVAVELLDGANRLASQTTVVAASAASGDDMRGGLADALSQIRAVLGRRREFGVQPEAARLIDRIEAELIAVIALLDRRGEIAAALSRQLVTLRWLTIDLQDQAEALIQDMAFQGSAEARGRAASASGAPRAATHPDSHDANRRLLFNAAFSGASVTTLLMQAASAEDDTQLRPLEDMAVEALEQMRRQTGQLDDRNDLLTFKQSASALAELTRKDGGLFDRRRSLIDTRRAILDRLSVAQRSLSELQGSLTRAGTQERAAIHAMTMEYIARSRGAIRWLIVMTALSALIGVALVFAYVRPGIVTPLRQLSDRLLDVAHGRAVPPLTPRGSHEIVALGRAVEAFRASVEARDAALGRLQHEVEERKKAMAELTRTQAELVQAEKMAALGTLSAGIAHEINQPLAAMKHRLYTLKVLAARDGDEGMAARIGVIEDLASRMEATVKALRGFARRSEHKLEPVDLGAVVAASGALLTARLNEAGITVDVGEGIAGARVIADQLLLEQVTVNLLANACDAIVERREAEGALAGRIAIRTRHEGAYRELHVEDNGAGLRDIAPQQAFDPFFTTKEVGKGLGLGLSISYSIVKDMGGDLRLEPLSAGTRAIVRLIAKEDG